MENHAQRHASTRCSVNVNFEILVIENLLLLFVHCIQSYVYVPFGKLSITSALAVGLSMRGQAIPFSETFIDTWGFASFDRIF